MSTSPDLEPIWLEYDAYAKLENTIEFVMTDLGVMQDYLKTKEPPLPSTIVHEFAKNLADMRKDAEDLEKHFAAPQAMRVVLMIWNHPRIGQLILSKHYSRLGQALEALDPVEWIQSLRELSVSVTEKMNSLLAKLNGQ
jgi:hypothetical protein